MIINIQMTFKKENKTSISLFLMQFANPSLNNKNFRIKLQFYDQEKILEALLNLKRHNLKPRINKFY